jgi:hypothetical protein
MGYSLQTNIVYGVALTEEEQDRLNTELDDGENEELWEDLHHSGDFRSTLHDPILGLQLASSSWGPSEIKLNALEADEDDIQYVKDLMRKYKIKYRKPKYYLVGVII